jgi:hypothetical protein
MNWLDDHLLKALANLIVCCLIGWACVCRFSMMDRHSTRAFTRWSYAVLFTAAGISGWQRVLFDEWPSWADLAVNVALLVFLASGIRAWRYGVPGFARSDAAPLDELPSENHQQ